MKIFKVIYRFFAGVCILILILLILQFIVNAKYTFPEPHPFKGPYIYNPYRNIDSTKWRKANFHAHTWKFLDKKEKASRSNPILDSLYRSFGYTIISISDYQFINRYESNNKWFVPVYEHGYQYYKNHQLVLNAKKVSWLDFPFRQTLNNKQSVINKLKKDTSALITIVHPGFRKAYSDNDLKYLGNYNCLEVANHSGFFTSCYDTILSNGHPVFLMADDDAHIRTKFDEVCSSLTLVNSDLVSDSILYALATGRSIGLKLNTSISKSNDEKRRALLKLPKITSIAFIQDTLKIGLNQSVKTIRFIGQNGIVKKRITDCSGASFYFSKQDTYIRTEIECNDGSVYLLNPYFRFEETRLTDYAPALNVFKTWMCRSSVLFILLIIFIIRYYKK